MNLLLGPTQPLEDFTLKKQRKQIIIVSFIATLKPRKEEETPATLVIKYYHRNGIHFLLLTIDFYDAQSTFKSA